MSDVDPDRPVPAPGVGAVLPVVALGGALGASARHALELAWPVADGRFPWTILMVNVTGSLLIGVLMSVVERGRAHPLLRPFAGVGVLGGYTTFSTYAVQALGLPVLPAFGYLAGTLVAALAAVALGLRLGRSVGGS